MASLPSFPFDFDVNKLLGDVKVPGVDFEGIVAAQRKNIDALQQANKTVLEGLQAVFQRQADILRASIDEATNAAKKVTSAGSPQDSIALQTEAVKDAFERAVGNSRELSDILAKSTQDASDLLNRRFIAMLDEIKDSVSKAK